MIRTGHPTVFDGYCFRSRLEAQWAAFWNALQIQYLYEPEIIFLNNPRRKYLPDFYLLDYNAWIEVKPTHRLSDKFQQFNNEYGIIGQTISGPPDSFLKDHILNFVQLDQETLPWVLLTMKELQNQFAERDFKARYKYDNPERDLPLLLETYGFKCFYCGQRLIDWSEQIRIRSKFDADRPNNFAHATRRIPLVHGGEATFLNNIVTCCHSCWKSKRSLTESAWFIEQDERAFRWYMNALTLEEQIAYNWCGSIFSK